MAMVRADVCVVMLRALVAVAIAVGFVRAQAEASIAREPDPKKMASVQPLAPAAAMAAMLASSSAMASARAGAACMREA